MPALATLPEFRTALDECRAALGESRVFDDAATLALYSSDETPKRVTPAAVVFPQHHDHVEALVRIALAHRVPLVARGAGSGNVGGALPVANGIVVSFECMQRVLEFDPDNRLIVVEAGVTAETIDTLARTVGLFYPPDPGSGAYAHIGGNLAMNAAGPRAVKYGVTRDYVLGLRAVPRRSSRDCRRCAHMRRCRDRAGKTAQLGGRGCRLFRR